MSGSHSLHFTDVATEDQQVEMIPLKSPKEEEAAPGSNPGLTDSGTHVVTTELPASLRSCSVTVLDGRGMTCAVESAGSQCGVGLVTCAPLTPLASERGLFLSNSLSLGPWSQVPSWGQPTSASLTGPPEGAEGMALC